MFRLSSIRISAGLPMLAFLMVGALSVVTPVEAAVSGPVSPDVTDLAAVADVADQEAPAKPADGTDPPAETTEAPATKETAEPALNEEADDDNETDEDEEESEIEWAAHLVITTDAPSEVLYGAINRGQLQPGETLEIGVLAQETTLTVRSTEDTHAVWKAKFLVLDGDRLTFDIKMIELLAELRKDQLRNSIFRDHKTLLMWSRKDNGADVRQESAAKYCNESELGGFDDWRLPTIEELGTLDAMWSNRPFKTADPITLTACCPWSSDVLDETRAMNFNFRFRKPFEGHPKYSMGHRALCTRDAGIELEQELIAQKEFEAERKLRKKARRARQKQRQEKRKAKEEVDSPPPSLGL